MSFSNPIDQIPRPLGWCVRCIREDKPESGSTIAVTILSGDAVCRSHAVAHVSIPKVYDNHGHPMGH